jgi:NitT/TauT family transport system substrate-binding protein
MQIVSWTMRSLAATLVGAAVLAAVPAAAQDKVKVGVFPVSSSLPYFVANERGYFKEQNIETEMVRLIGGPPNIAALITGQIDAAAVLVTIEGMNANVKKPGVATYIAINAQNKDYIMEQFVVRSGHPAKTIKDLKGAKILSAPGPANLTAARAVLTAAGLKEGEYTLDQLDMGQHVNALKAGTFDAGYTLEPNATAMIKAGIARRIEAGVVAKYILNDPNANAFAAGAAVSADFIKNRPDVAKRFAAAWSKAVDLINNNPKEARKHLLKNTFTPPGVVDDVPMVRYFMVKSLTPKDRQQFQQLIDFAVKAKVIPEPIDVNKYLHAF